MNSTTFHDQATEESSRTLSALEQNFNMLYDKCTTDDDRNLLRNQLIAARDAYWKMESESLEDENEIVKGLFKDLQDTNKKIEAEVDDLNTAVDALKLFGEAIKLAAAISALAAV